MAYFLILARTNDADRQNLLPDGMPENSKNLIKKNLLDGFAFLCNKLDQRNYIEYGGVNTTCIRRNMLR